MKVVVQRTREASVSVLNKVVGRITHGMVVFVCFEKGDAPGIIPKAAAKLAALRIFEDPASGKMSRNLAQTGGQLLLISQFTLSWDGTGGHRPGFELSMEPQEAKVNFRLLCDELGALVPLEKGEFAAQMEVSLVNDGPVTFVLNF